MTVWSLTTDTDAGLFTSLFLTEEQAYDALIDQWFPDDPSTSEEEAANRIAALEALSKGIKDGNAPIIDWFSKFDAGSDLYIIERHDHPWTFGSETEPSKPSDPLERIYAEAFAPDNSANLSPYERQSRAVREAHAALTAAADMSRDGDDAEDFDLFYSASVQLAKAFNLPI